MTAENQAKLQYTFDSIAAHMLTQNAKSLNAKGHCAYRGADNTRCGVGFIIPNDKYSEDIENIGVEQCLIVMKAESYPSFLKEQHKEKLGLVVASIGDEYCNDEDFLKNVQRLHDQSGPQRWATGFRVIARYYKLDASIVDTFTNANIPQLQECQTV